MYKYFAVHKPFGMLSQFSREGGNKSLADLNFAFEKDIYPIGRLDAESEGLLLLSNDPSLNQELLPPEKSHWRKYLVQVEGLINDKSREQLMRGVKISINGKPYMTLACRIEIVSKPESLPERIPPVRFRKSIPTSWLTLELREGKNRQVRKMTAVVGLPTLRLIRIGIAGILLEGIEQGEVMEFSQFEFMQKLNIKT